jgi:hypothetical protein
MQEDLLPRSERHDCGSCSGTVSRSGPAVVAISADLRVAPTRTDVSEATQTFQLRTTPSAVRRLTTPRVLWRYRSRRRRPTIATPQTRSSGRMPGARLPWRKREHATPRAAWRPSARRSPPTRDSRGVEPVGTNSSERTVGTSRGPFARGLELAGALVDALLIGDRLPPCPTTLPGPPHPRIGGTAASGLKGATGHQSRPRTRTTPRAASTSPARVRQTRKRRDRSRAV